MSTQIHLRASNGNYVCAEDGGGHELVANRTSAAEWETFNLVDLDGNSLQSNNTVNLQGYNGMWVCAEGGGGGPVMVNRLQPAGWETFTVLLANGASGEITNGQQISLRANNGQYMRAENGGGREVVASSNGIGPWETFTLELLGTAPVSRPTLRLRVNSDLGAGHFMDSTARLEPGGLLRCVTRTRTVTMFGGFHGQVVVGLVDADDLILVTTDRTFGVDGTWVGRSDRLDSWSEQFGPVLDAQTSKLMILHLWNPRSDWQQYVRRLVDVALSGLGNDGSGGAGGSTSSSDEGNDEDSENDGEEDGGEGGDGEGDGGGDNTSGVE